MPTSRKSPKDVIKIRRGQELREGDFVTIRAKVTRVGKETDDNPHKITIQLSGVPTPVTLSPDFLETEE